MSGFYRRKTKYELLEKDFYPTPSWVTEELLRRINFSGRIWEPCSGNGAISKVLESHGYKVFSSDIRQDDKVYGRGNVDFLASKAKNIVNNIVTNPPYKYAQEMVEQGLRLATRKVVFFLKLTFLESQSRYQLFQTSPFKSLYVLSKRATLYPANQPEPENTGTIAYAWYVWEHGYKESSSIYWIKCELRD